MWPKTLTKSIVIEISIVIYKVILKQYFEIFYVIQAKSICPSYRPSVTICFGCVIGSILDGKNWDRVQDIHFNSNLVEQF